MANRYVDCYFLGYSAKHKRFLCLDMASSWIYASCHVVFDETQFPFLTKFLSSQPVSSSNYSSTLLDSGILSILTQSSRDLNHHQPNFSSPIIVPTNSAPISTPSDFPLVSSNPHYSLTLPQSSSPTSNVDHLLLLN